MTMSCNPFGSTVATPGDAGTPANPGDADAVAPAGDSGTVAPGDAGPDAAPCLNVSGNWTISTLCNGLVNGSTVKVGQNGCSLSVDSPPLSLTGSISGDNIQLTGSETCNGNAEGTALLLTCNPGSCAVTLSR
jgi:hypothetical protein